MPEFDEPLGPDFSEDEIWQRRIKPLLEGWPDNVVQMCAYALTEMLNNANDHSGARKVHIQAQVESDNVTLHVIDLGVGIFANITNKLALENERHAIFELTKGKVTTDPDRHTGEGIFFTSRMCEKFGILSSTLYLSHSESEDWLLENSSPGDKTNRGTCVKMQFIRDSSRTMKEVFDRYSSSDQDDYGFKKTKVAVALADEADILISRSQAKRVLSRLERFQEVILDFEGIKSIGPAFADEIFRVFRRNHREVTIIPARANDEVSRMISKAQSEAATEDP